MQARVARVYANVKPNVREAQIPLHLEMNWRVLRRRED
jgi:hypothetical protein